MLLVLATLARTPLPRTRTALVLINTGAIATAAGAVTLGVGAWLFTSPFAQDGEGCIPPRLQGQSACGPYTLWTGLALGTAGVAAMTLSFPLVEVGLRLPREHSQGGEETGSIYVEAGANGLRLHGTF